MTTMSANNNNNSCKAPVLQPILLRAPIVPVVLNMDPVIPYRPRQTIEEHIKENNVAEQVSHPVMKVNFSAAKKGNSDPLILTITPKIDATGNYIIKATSWEFEYMRDALQRINNCRITSNKWNVNHRGRNANYMKPILLMSNPPYDKIE